MDDDLQLSSHALSALQEFLKEQEAIQLKLEQKEDLDMDAFQEDWQLSQFWYSDDTRQRLAKAAIEHTPDGGYIGCVSSPSVFLTLNKMDIGNRKIFVFEYDKRFAVFPQFVFFDYNHPLDLQHTLELKHQFDFLIVDPPFLSDECWTKTAMTVRELQKPDAKILVCTGQVMESKVCSELGLKRTPFAPKHSNQLSNDFSSFSNFTMHP
ncbi:putative N6-adenine methyltransferase-domain-containing protein [Gorgonomyces haynaldii]|nr:putative N6-adenine methyltransferase-domain-containing protein [Gorgonomyces haynaldii]